MIIELTMMSRPSVAIDAEVGLIRTIAKPLISATIATINQGDNGGTPEIKLAGLNEAWEQRQIGGLDRTPPAPSCLDAA